MATKLTVEDLDVQSFTIHSPGDVHLDSATDVGCPGESYDGCDTGADPCFSQNPLCSLPCIEPSRRTNIAGCCG